MMYDDYCRVITPENLLTEECEEVGSLAAGGAASFLVWPRACLPALEVAADGEVAFW
jgi:hypothetical protein